MNLIEEAYRRLFPEEPFSFETKLEYNCRLDEFNANIRFNQRVIAVNLNLQWKDIDNEIKIGLIQNLLLRALKRKLRSSPNIELYHNFIKQVHLLAPRIESDPCLKESFQRVNSNFFFDQLALPNLIWGQKSFRKLASYNFHNDTITVSTIFQGERNEIIDYLMYHELLHKAQQFKHRNGRSFFHTREFRAAEKEYPDYFKLEQELKAIIRSKRRKNSFWRFF